MNIKIFKTFFISDLIKLHNELMSVQQKLIECEKALNSPVDCETHLDTQINHMLGLIVTRSKSSMLLTPPSSTHVTTSSSNSNSLKNNSKDVASNSIESKANSRTSESSDVNNNKISSYESISGNSRVGFSNVEALFNKYYHFLNF